MSRVRQQIEVILSVGEEVLLVSGHLNSALGPSLMGLIVILRSVTARDAEGREI